MVNSNIISDFEVGHIGRVHEIALRFPETTENSVFKTVNKVESFDTNVFFLRSKVPYFDQKKYLYR